MAAILTTSLGKVTYTDDTLSKLAGLSVTDCYGVVGMANKGASDGIAGFLKSDNIKKGIKVKTSEDNTVSFELFIVVKYGISISAVAANLIDTVKKKIEETTGLSVTNVDVVVQGIKVE